MISLAARLAFAGALAVSIAFAATAICVAVLGVRLAMRLITVNTEVLVHSWPRRVLMPPALSLAAISASDRLLRRATSKKGATSAANDAAPARSVSAVRLILSGVTGGGRHPSAYHLATAA